MAHAAPAAAVPRLKQILHLEERGQARKRRGRPVPVARCTCAGPPNLRVRGAALM